MDSIDGGAGGAGGDGGGNVGGAADFLGDGAQAGGGDGGAAGGAADGAGAGAGGGTGGGADGAAAAGGDGAGGDPQWFADLSGETGEGESASNLDWVKSKGFKSQDDIVKSLRSAEKRLHEGGGIKVPGDDAKPEDIAAYRTAIGVPEKPDGYALPAPKDAAGNPIEINTAVMERVTQAAHKHGIPKASLDAVLEDLVAADVADHDTLVKDRQAKAGEHVKGWGDDREAKLAQVNAAAKEAGFTREDMEYLRGLPSGPGKVLDHLAKHGANFSEDSLVRGESRTFGMTSAQAQKEIDAIKADSSLLDKALVPGTAENARYNRALEALGAAADKVEA
jgi:hypothetical protein